MGTPPSPPPPGPGNLKIQTNFLQLLSQIRAFYRPAILKSVLFQASTTKTIHNWDIYRTILIKLNSDLSFLIYMNYSVFQTKVRNSGIIRATLAKWPKFGFWPNFAGRLVALSETGTELGNIGAISGPKLQIRDQIRFKICQLVPIGTVWTYYDRFFYQKQTHLGLTNAVIFN